MNYLKTIEQFFLSLKDSGLTLSSSDYQLIEEWEKRNIPIELICSEVQHAYYRLEKKRQDRRRGSISLTQLRNAVEERIQTEINKK